MQAPPPADDAAVMAQLLQEAQAQIGQLRAELYSVGRVAEERRCARHRGGGGGGTVPQGRAAARAPRQRAAARAAPPPAARRWAAPRPRLALEVLMRERDAAAAAARQLHAKLAPAAAAAAEGRAAAVQLEELRAEVSKQSRDAEQHAEVRAARRGPRIARGRGLRPARRTPAAAGCGAPARAHVRPRRRACARTPRRRAA